MKQPKQNSTQEAQRYMPRNGAEVATANQIMDAMQRAMIRACPRVEGQPVLTPRTTVGMILTLAAWAAAQPLRGADKMARRGARREFMKLAADMFDSNVEHANEDVSEAAAPIATLLDVEPTQGNA